MSWRSGATVRDLEFVQFHPTALTIPGANSFLISEAVRGEGAHLVDDTGRRFAFDYHPKGELAPRDVVSRAIFTHLQKNATDPTKANVWLDLRPIPAAIVSSKCSKGESSLDIAAAIPPCAQSLADKETVSLVIKPIVKLSGRQSAVYRPAAPAPTTKTSKV
jgi:succinate dehydrogenase/fumarate reductase flavoprotein subunit